MWPERPSWLATALLTLAACRGSVSDPNSGVRPGRAPADGSEAAGGTIDAGEAAASTTTTGAMQPREPGAVATGGKADGGQKSASSAPGTADSVWSPLSVMKVVDPTAYGAQANGSADDLPALKAAVDALPAEGGVVFFPSGKKFKKSDLWVITKSHVKLWSINREAELFQSVNGQRRHQSILCRRNTGCGVFGLKLRSDANSRFDALEDNQISADAAKLVEVAGVEVQGSAATGIFLYGSTESYIEGNYVHHTWADHVHHTNGAQASWVWNNYIFNEAPSKGDDGVACVTYGPNSPRCGDMEWWHNTILHTDWGRGYSVIGGNDIQIHDNWARGVAGAGIIVASETSYNTSASQAITIANNYVEGCGHGISHPGILVSGQSSQAGPLRDIALNSNVSVGTPAGPYRAEGSIVNVTNLDLKSAASALPSQAPSQANVKLADTRVLRTRDVSHVPEPERAGLYRIHVRRTDNGSYQQRFEYLVKGPGASLGDFTRARRTAGDYVSEQRSVEGTDYALLLTAAPVTLPGGLSGVTFRELRDKDRAGTLSWLWNRADTGSY